MSLAYITGLSAVRYDLRKMEYVLGTTEAAVYYIKSGIVSKVEDLPKAKGVVFGSTTGSNGWLFVIAVDLLGLQPDRTRDILALPRTLLKREQQPDGSVISTFLRDPLEVLDEYGTVAPDGVRLVVMGAVGHGGAG